MEAVKNLNGEMWIFAFLLIAIVVLQACWFLRLALRYNKKHNYFTKEEVGPSAQDGFGFGTGPGLQCGSCGNFPYCHGGQRPYLHAGGRHRRCRL